MCKETLDQTTPLSASTSSSGKYSMTIRIPKGINKASTCITYAGLIYSGCMVDPDAIPVLAVATLIAIEDMIRASIDPNYIVPTITGMGPQTLVETQDFFNEFYTEGTPNPVFQAAVSCLISQVYFAVRSAVIRSITMMQNMNSCTSAPFFTSTGKCATIEIRIN